MSVRAKIRLDLVKLVLLLLVYYYYYYYYTACIVDFPIKVAFISHYFRYFLISSLSQMGRTQTRNHATLTRIHSFIQNP